MDAAAFEALLQAAQQRINSDTLGALQLADQALAMLGPEPDPTLHAKAQRYRGNALSFAGRDGEALTTLQQALDGLPAGISNLRVDLLRDLCAACSQAGDLGAALEVGLRAAAAARELGHQGRLADTLISIGVVRSRSGDHAEGLAYYEEALQAYEAGGERRMVHTALCNIGIAYKNLDRLEASVQHLERSAELARELGDDGLLAMSLTNLGEPLRKLGRLPESLDVATRAVAGLQQAGLPYAETHAHVLRGQVLGDLGQAEQALDELQHALALAQRLHSVDLEARAHLALAGLHKSQGRFEQALLHHESYHGLERRQFNEASARTLQALKVRFELERAQHEARVQRLEAQRLAEQSRTDALTGVANRRRLDEHLGSCFESARRLGRPLAVAMVDIDNFKRINDAFGHTVGDSVLRAVAQCLRDQCRAIDLVARFGGEEFCIVFSEADAALAERACEAMREAVERHPWAEVHPALAVTVSVGLADHPALDSPLALLADADNQLYAAKRGGKNRVVRAA